MKTMKPTDKVIINTGGKDINGTICEGKHNKKGYYWASQDCYLIEFENKTRQYIPSKYIKEVK